MLSCEAFLAVIIAAPSIALAISDSLVLDVGYTEDFSTPVLLPWVEYNFDQSNVLLPGDRANNGKLSGTRVISPSLPVPFGPGSGATLRVEMIADEFNGFSEEYAPTAELRLRSYADTDADAVLAVSFPFSVDYQTPFTFSRDQRYTGVIDLTDVPLLLPEREPLGLVVEIESPGAIRSVAFDWSRPAAGAPLSWELGQSASPVPAGWSGESLGGQWYSDNGIAAVDADIEAEVIRVEAITPAFRFTSLADAQLSLQLELADFDFSAVSDRIEIDLLDAAGELISNIKTLDLWDVTRRFGETVAGVIDSRIIDDAFGGQEPRDHEDSITTYRVRTRIWDEDDEKFDLGPNRFQGSLGIGSFTITDALIATPGDYNGDGLVDAADYTVWRDAVATGDPIGDGNFDGVTDAGDYSVWRDAYASTTLPAFAVPEPAWQAVATPIVALLAASRRVVRRGGDTVVGSRTRPFLGELSNR